MSGQPQSWWASTAAANLTASTYSWTATTSGTSYWGSTSVPIVQCNHPKPTIEVRNDWLGGSYVVIRAGGDTWQVAVPAAFQAMDDLAARSAPRDPPPRTFNRYINASDLLEEFIGYLKTQRVRADEVMGLPVELFIKWLVLRACEEDHEEAPPEAQMQLPTRRAPKCLGCGRFMRRAPVLLHGPECADYYYARQPREAVLA